MNRIVVLLLLLLPGCKKEITTVVNPDPIKLVGTLTITPSGNQTDTFSYSIVSPSHPENAYIPDVIKSGKVLKGPFIIHLVERSTYKVHYRDLSGAQTMKEYLIGDSVVFFNDSLPATVY